MSILQRIQKFSVTAGFISLGLTCFFLPFSTSLMGLTSLLCCLFWLLSGKVTSLPRLMISNIAVFLAMALLILLGVDLFCTIAPLEEAISVFKKYRELLFFAVTVSLLGTNTRAARIAENSFIGGCCLLLLVSFGIYAGLLPPMKYGYSMVYHITHSFFMALLAFWALQRTFDAKHYKFFWLLLFIASSTNLFFIAPGRTGMFIYVSLLLLTIVQRLSLLKSLATGMLALLFLGAIYYISPNVHIRVNEAVNEIQRYNPESESSRTSLGMRFDWWQNSVDLIKANPWKGYGTGAFRAAQATIINGTQTKPSDNPHNEYLMLAVQTGIPGAGLYVGLLLCLLLISLKLPKQPRYLLQGTVVAMATGCLMNSFLFDSHQGHFFAFLAAVLSVQRTEDEESLPV